MAARLKGMGSAKYQRDGDPITSGPGFGLVAHVDTLKLPFRWRKPHKVFVNSMSDLFHDKIEVDFIAQVFAVMSLTPRHTYQLLTKRHARMRNLLNDSDFQALVNHHRNQRKPDNGEAAWPLPNLHLGVSCEDQKWAETRIPALLETPAAIRWISAEPLIGPIDLRNLRARNGALIDCLSGDVKTSDGREVYTCCPSVLDWIVLGGESGHGARPMSLTWVTDVIDQARDRTAVFVKQLGSAWASDTFIGGKSVAARGDRKGGNPEFWDLPLRVREFPTAVTA